MPETIRVRIEEQSQVADGRRFARTMAQNLGFDEVRAGQVAIVATEVCTNLLKHAGGGDILLQSLDGDAGSPVLELFALDKGPGIGNLDQCLRDGYSTGGSSGHGLGAIVRLTSGSDFYSEAGRGAAVLARWSAGSHQPDSRSLPLQIGSVSICKPGQEVCGDDWGAAHSADSSVIMVADGLGHGIDARAASAEAVRILHTAPPALSPAELVERVHLALRSTRGAALAVARVDRSRDRITFSGIGNISAHVYTGANESQHLVSVHGTAGFQTARIREFEYPWPERGLLLMYSDGLSSHTSPAGYPGLALRDPALIAGVLYRDFARGNDDATIVAARAA